MAFSRVLLLTIVVCLVNQASAKPKLDLEEKTALSARDEEFFHKLIPALHHAGTVLKGAMTIVQGLNSMKNSLTGLEKREERRKKKKLFGKLFKSASKVVGKVVKKVGSAAVDAAADAVADTVTNAIGEDQVEEEKRDVIGFGLEKREEMVEEEKRDVIGFGLEKRDEYGRLDQALSAREEEELLGAVFKAASKVAGKVIKKVAGHAIDAVAGAVADHFIGEEVEEEKRDEKQKLFDWLFHGKALKKTALAAKD